MSAGVLSKKEIITLSDTTSEAPLVSDIGSQYFPPAAYDLRAGHIITANEYLELDPKYVDNPARQGRFRIILRPGETATIATYETLTLPRCVNGIIVPRDRYAKRGLLTLNAGQIDPGFTGFVTAQVINLTSQPFPLDLAESYFSAIFSYVENPGDGRKGQDQDDAGRLRVLRMTAAQSPVFLPDRETLKETFVSKDQLTWELTKRGIAFLLAVAAVAGTVAGVIVLANP